MSLNEDETLPFVAATKPKPVGEPTGGVRFGPFRLHGHLRLLERNGAPVPLGSRAFDLLDLLVARAGEVVPKRDLMAHAWRGLHVGEASLRWHISALRRALGDGINGVRYVTNISSCGYCFVGAIEGARVYPTVLGPPKDSLGALPERCVRPIGREAVLAEVCKRLSCDGFLTVRGPGGVGKTTLAIAAAQHVRRVSDVEVRYLTLSESDLPAEAAIRQALARDPLPDLDRRASAAAPGRNILLVLDGCDHEINAAAKGAERIYQTAPEISILATSREALGAEHECILDLPPLATPEFGPYTDWLEAINAPAVRLFLERAAAGGFLGQVSEKQAGDIGRICQRLDGLPLAIELAGTRAGLHGLAGTMALLDGAARLAWPGRRTAPARHRSLRACLDWSYRLLDETEQKVLCRVGAIDGGFTRSQAIAASADGALSPESAAVALDRLIATSLVEADRSAMAGGYRLGQTTQIYAREKLYACRPAMGEIRRHDAGRAANPHWSRDTGLS